MKNKSTAGLLAILLGTFGAHKFYLGKTGQGIVYLLLMATGISTLLGIIEGIIYFTQSQEAFDLKYNTESPSQAFYNHENALYALHGIGGQLFVYENRVVISHKGALGFLSQGLSGEKTLPMKAIQSVQFREGGSAINGFIQFGVLGGNEKQGGILSAADDENSVVFTKSQNALAFTIKSFIESKIY